MGIMDMFSNVFGSNQQPQNPAAAPAGTPPTPGQIPANPSAAATPGQGAVPAGSGTPPVTPAPDANKSPLDAFTDLWKPVETKPGDQPPGYNFNVDPSKLMEAAGKVDFSKVVTPETLQKIAAGGEAGVAASLEAMNRMSQTVYAQSALASTKIVEQALARAEEKFAAQVPGLIKSHQVSDSLRSDNPALSHPAAQPILQALQSQLTQKFPSATVAEIKEMANNYFAAFATSAVPAKVDPVAEAKAKKDAGTDWSTFLQ